MLKEDYFSRHWFLGILAAAIMVITGLMLLIAPVIAIVDAGILFLAGIIMEGLFLLVRFFRARQKNYWDLATGIIDIVFGVWIAYVWFAQSEALAEGLIINLLGMFFAVMLLVSGFNRINYVSMLKSVGDHHIGLITFSGWMNIMLAVFFIFTPFAATFTFAWISGIYFLLAGLTLCIESIALRIMRHKK